MSKAKLNIVIVGFVEHNAWKHFYWETESTNPLSAIQCNSKQCTQCKSSRPEVFCRKGVLRPEAWNFIQKESLAQVFSSDFCEIFKKTVFYRTTMVAASVSALFYLLLITNTKNKISLRITKLPIVQKRELTYQKLHSYSTILGDIHIFIYLTFIFYIHILYRLGGIDIFVLFLLYQLDFLILKSRFTEYFETTLSAKKSRCKKKSAKNLVGKKISHFLPPNFLF